MQLKLSCEHPKASLLCPPEAWRIVPTLVLDSLVSTLGISIKGTRHSVDF